MSGLALMLEVGGQVDRCRPALAELTPDGVAAFEGCVETAKEALNKTGVVSWYETTGEL